MFHKTPTNATTGGSHTTPASHGGPIDKTVVMANTMTKVWMALTLVGVAFPDIAVKVFSVDFGEEASENELRLIKVLTKIGFLHLSFAAALQGAATVGGSVLQANTRKGVMRAVNFTNACWCAAVCLFIWLYIQHEMIDNGWGTRVPLSISFVMAGLGAACYSASKGEEKSYFGGMLRFKLHSNAEDLEVPPFSKENMVFLFWMGVSGLAAVLMVLAPGAFLAVHVGDALTGKPLAWAKLGVQALGFFYGLTCVSLNLLVSSHLGSLLYHAVRGLSAAGLATLIGTVCLRDELELLGVESKMIVADIVLLAVLVIMAANCIKAHFSQVVRAK